MRKWRAMLRRRSELLISDMHEIILHFNWLREISVSGNGMPERGNVVQKNLVQDRKKKSKKRLARP